MMISPKLKGSNQTGSKIGATNSNQMQDMTGNNLVEQDKMDDSDSSESGYQTYN